MNTATRDVLQHHDGVVHHESGCDRERHQRQVVEAVAQEVHGGEGAHQRYRYRHGWHERGPHVSQKDEHDQHHECHREQQRVLNVGDARPDRRRAVHRHR
jgi:hypothetical protein